MKKALFILTVLGIAITLSSQTVRTDHGQGADAYVRNGNFADKNSGKAGVFLANGSKQDNFGRRGILRFDLNHIKNKKQKVQLLLHLQMQLAGGMKEGERATVNVYGIKDGTTLDKSPKNGGWLEGDKKGKQAAAENEISWNSLTKALNSDLTSLDGVANVVKLGTISAKKSDNKASLISPELSKFIADDKNNLVTMILVGENGVIVARAKEWGKFVAPALEFGAVKADQAVQKKPAKKAAPVKGIDLQLKDSSDSYHQKLYAELKDLNPGRLVFGTSPDSIVPKILLQANNKKMATKSIVDVGEKDTLKFNKALQLQCEPKLCKKYWDPHLVMISKAPIKKGEYVYMTMWARSLIGAQDGHFKTHLYLDTAGKGKCIKAWHKIFPDSWHRLHYWVKLKEDVPAGKYRLTLHCGPMGGPPNQGLELGGISAITFPANTNPEDFPNEKFEMKYEGMEEDAQWRKDAFARIEKHRKGNLNIQVVDDAGKPIPDAKVIVAMQNHAFGFGNELVAGYFPDTAYKARKPFLLEPHLSMADRLKYLNEFKSIFNRSTGGCYWYGWEEPKSRINKYETMAGLEWLKKNNFKMPWLSPFYARQEKQPLRVRHLFEPNQPNAPDKLKEEIKKYLKEYTKEMAKYGPFIYEYGNEWEISYDLHRMYGGDNFLVWIFNYTKELLPNVQFGCNDPSFSDAFLKRLKFLKQNGIEINHVAIQSHMDFRKMVPPKSWPEKIAKFAKETGAKINISEFDFALEKATDPEQRAFQAKYVRDSYIAFFSAPACEQLTYWGFWEPVMWYHRKNRGVALFNKDWSINPHGQAIKDLIKKEWWTNADGKTDAQGNFKTRGFLGDYKITVEAGGKKKTIDLVLAKKGSDLKVKL